MIQSYTNQSGFNPFSGPQLEAVIPLTDSQKEIWIATKIDSQSSLGYIESLSVHIRGDIKLNALYTAINKLINRHEILRSTVSPDGTRLYIMSDYDNPPLVQDINTNDLHKIINEEMNQAFDLIKGPLFRTRILCHDKDYCTLIISAHHIICDGWSLDTILSDLSVLYTSCLNGNESGFQKPAPRFSEYVSIWHDKLQLEVKRCETYWKTVLNGEIPNLDLPLDYKRPDIRTYRAESISLQADNDFFSSLKTLSSKNNTSLFVTLLTAWTATLSRISNQTDIIIGIPAAGQPDMGMENLVGHCVSFLPVRTFIKNSDTFTVLLQKAKSSLYSAYEHRSLSFGRLVQIINMPRNLSRIPLVSASLTHTQKYALDKIRFGNCTVDYYLNPRCHEIFEINLNAIESSNGLRLLCHFNADLFNKNSVSKWLNELQDLIINVNVNDNWLLRPSLDIRDSKHLSDLNNPLPENKFRNGLENAVKQIWVDVLKIPLINPDDNFFDIGGHSILLAEVQQKINIQFERNVSMTELFQHPTVRLMAQYLSDMKTSTSDSSLSNARGLGKKQRQFFQE